MSEAMNLCPHFGICGGCRYLDLSYEEELKVKENQVRELLEQAMEESAKYVSADELGSCTDVNTWFTGILRSPKEFEYRNKMEFSFGDEYKDGPLALGMHKKGSFFDIVTVDGCRIVDEDYRAIIRAVLDFFTERKETYFHKKRHEGFLRHLLVRKALHTGEILVDLVTSAEEGHSLEGFAEMLCALPLKGNIVGVLNTVNTSIADVIHDDGTTVLFGRDWFTEELLGLKFRVTPFSFFQTNSYGAEVMYETARQYVDGIGGGTYPVIYDLYCGTGTITQLMAAKAEKVIGVEIVPEAVEAARGNAERNGVKNCEFICGDVLKVIDSMPVKPDMIILDPPRDGIHPKALPKIISFGVKDILYISCKPKSLARDLPSFLAAGYRPVKACCVDEFPWTNNVETICLLSKSSLR